VSRALGSSVAKGSTVKIVAPNPPNYNARPRSPLPHVFILGSGFSKAVSTVMPTLPQLGAEIAAHLVTRPSFQLLPESTQQSLRRGEIPLGDLEVWLSTLAIPAPFVSPAEAHYNAGIFSEIANLIGDEVETAEISVLDADPKSPPPWLESLIRLWNGVGATVITFNYDTLVEHGATLIRPVDDRWPNVTFNLLKLHGSTSLWRARGESSGQFVLEELLPGWGHSAIRQDQIGYERVIVPPVAAKGSYYEPPFIVQQWDEARRAMERATRLFIVGYRLSANDLATTTLISQHLAQAAEIILVNLNPVEPTAVLKQIGRPPSRVLSGPDCVKVELIADYERAIGTDLLPRFVDTLAGIADLPVQAYLPETGARFHVVTDVIEEKDRIALLASDDPFAWSDEARAVRVSKLKAYVSSTGKRIVVRYAGAEYPAMAIAVQMEPVAWVRVEG